MHVCLTVCLSACLPVCLSVLLFDHQNNVPVVRLSYHGKNHYNAVVDPTQPPPFGDGKARKVNLAQLRKDDDAKNTTKIFKPPTIIRQISGEMSRRKSANLHLITPREDPASQLTDSDYNDSCMPYMDPTDPISVSEAKTGAMIENIIQALFAKQIRYHGDKQEALEKLHHDIITSSKEFERSILVTLEIEHGKLPIAKVIEAFKLVILPDIMWRIRQLLGKEKVESPSEERKKEGEGSISNSQVEKKEGQTTFSEVERGSPNPQSSAKPQVEPEASDNAVSEEATAPSEDATAPSEQATAPKV